MELYSPNQTNECTYYMRVSLVCRSIIATHSTVSTAVNNIVLCSINLELCRASDIMSSPPLTIGGSETVATLARLLIKTSHSGFPVVRRSSSSSSVTFNYQQQQPPHPTDNELNRQSDNRISTSSTTTSQSRFELFSGLITRQVTLHFCLSDCMFVNRSRHEVQKSNKCDMSENSQLDTPTLLGLLWVWEKISTGPFEANISHTVYFSEDWVMGIRQYIILFRNESSFN